MPADNIEHRPKPAEATDWLTYEYVIELMRRLRADNANRNGEYDLARQRVDGVLWDSQTNPAPANRYSLSANYLLPIAQKHVQLLVGRLPGLQVMPISAEEEDRRHAEKLEGLLYSVWHASNIRELLQRVAWDSFVLRRGIVGYRWDPTAQRVNLHYVVPDNFYPEYDGEEIEHAVLISRRHVNAMKRMYPNAKDLISAEPPGEVEQIYGQDQIHREHYNHVTVIDYFDKDGNWARIVGDHFVKAGLAYPEGGVPFVDFPYQPASGDQEPHNGIDQLVELVQYLSQLISQKADVIRTFANPTILDFQSGQPAEEIRRAVAADGSVLPVHRDGRIEFLNWTGAIPAIDEQLQLVLDVIFDISGKPRSAFGQTITNQSGVMTNLSLTPTLQSNEYHETLWGNRLAFLNRRILQLTEKFGSGMELQFRGYRPVGSTHQNTKLVDLIMDGKEIAGWYESQIKWPSAIRSDDPVHVQNVLSQMQSNPPAISLYTGLEELGKEDVEAEIDRILEQLEDPRLHPDRLQAGLDAAGGLADPSLASGLAGGGGGPDPQALEAAGSPDRDILA